MNLIKSLVLSTCLLFSSVAMAQRESHYGGHSVVGNSRGIYHDEHGHQFGIKPHENRSYGDFRGYRDYRYNGGFYGYRGFVAPYIIYPYLGGWAAYGCDNYNYYSGYCMPYDYYYGPYTGLNINIR